MSNYSGAFGSIEVTTEEFLVKAKCFGAMRVSKHEVALGNEIFYTKNPPKEKVKQSKLEEEWNINPKLK